jgi:hypothetical protein
MPSTEKRKSMLKLAERIAIRFFGGVEHPITTAHTTEAAASFSDYGYLNKKKQKVCFFLLRYPYSGSEHT